MTSKKRQRTLDAFKVGDNRQLWSVAKELFETGFFNCFLTPQQFNLLRTLLYCDIQRDDADMQIWNAFMKGSLILRFKEDAGDDTNSNENMYMKPGYPTLRNLNATVRYLLYEKAIDYYYFKDDHDCKEFELLEDTLQLNNDLGGLQNDNNQIPSQADAPSAQALRATKKDDDEDDDYDDDDDDSGSVDHEDGDSQMKIGDHCNEEHKTGHATGYRTKDLIVDDKTKDFVLLLTKEELLRKPDYPAEPEISADEEAVGKMVHPILGTSSAIESSIEKQNELRLMKSFNKIYHGLENDLPNMVKKRKLERSDKQLKLAEEVQEKGNPEDNDSEQVNKLMSLGGAANLSMKNLLQRIDSNRDKLGVTDIELKNLIMDVRKNRSKWANYNRIGQEELYEACEKVVTELRSYTEHSTPFLNRVSKREAPNYYHIIKKPMDLNTVLKKLKTLQYQNKTQFVDDLMLIWQNCLTYNSDPKHFLRIDAIAMRKKTLMLIPLIPDITIRDRAEVEKEAAEQAKKEKVLEDSETPAAGRMSTRGVTQSKTKKGRKGVNSYTPIIIDGATPTPAPDASVDDSVVGTAAGTPLPPGTAEDTAETSTNGEQDTKSGDGQKEEESSKDNGGEDDEDDADADVDADADEDDEDSDNEQLNQQNVEQGIQEDDPDGIRMTLEELNEDTDDLEISTWKTLTSNTRYKLCNERSRLFKENKLQPNVEATIRTKSQMYNFTRYLEDENKIVLHRNRRYFDENDDPYLIEYDVAGGVPQINHHEVDLEKAEDELLEEMIAEGKSLEDIPASRFKVKLQGSNNLVLENISLMQDIRKVCFKINLIRTMQTSQFIHKSEFQAPKKPRIKFEDIDPMSTLKTRDPMTERIAFESLKKPVSALVMLNGFEQTTPTCMSLLTEVAALYMLNLAKSMKQHLESKSINKIPMKNHMPLTCREVVQIVLNYNGVDKPDEIYAYYKEQLTKQNSKLVDLKCGLENFLCDLLRPSMQELSETQFNDDSEQFVNGEFSDEIGEDFFGFKELGLDREFGLLTSNIPLHLLQSKLSHQFSQMNKQMVKRIYEDFNEVKFPKMKKKDIPDQIGLMQPFYEDLFIKTRLTYNKQLKRYQAQMENGETPDEPFTEIADENETELIEDEDLPQKQRNNRPKVPPNGKITQIKKKFTATAFFIDRQEKNQERLDELFSKRERDRLALEKKSEEEVVENVEGSDVVGPDLNTQITDADGDGDIAMEEDSAAVEAGDCDKKESTSTLIVENVTTSGKAADTDEKHITESTAEDPFPEGNDNAGGERANTPDVEMEIEKGVD
jgi:transcriptional activator SPT7